MPSRLYTLTVKPYSHRPAVLQCCGHKVKALRQIHAGAKASRQTANRAREAPVCVLRGSTSCSAATSSDVLGIYFHAFHALIQAQNLMA